LQQIIAKPPAAEEQASDVSQHWISVEGRHSAEYDQPPKPGASPACGVVESMRESERQSDVGGQYVADIKVARGVTGGVPGSTMAANAITGKGYEITVRFRDDSTTVLNEASPRTWPLGSQVMVIGQSNASSN
jgi:hypothetical protein